MPTFYLQVKEGRRKMALADIPLTRQERSGYLLAAPVFLFLVVFFVVPTLLLFVFSFWQVSNFTLVPDFTFENYFAAIARPAVGQSMWTGMRVGFWCGLIATALSFPVAWYIAFNTRSNVLLYLVLLSWFSSYLVRIFAWRTILGTKGMINSALMSSGLIDQPLGFLIFSPTAVIITLVHIFVPFTLLLLLSALRNVTPDHLYAARDLGGSRLQTLTRVVFPIAYKGIIGSFMFTFILAAGDFVTPQLLGGRNGATLGLLISDQFRVTGNWPSGAAMAFLLLVIFLFIYFLLALSLRWTGLAPGVRFHPLYNDNPNGQTTLMDKE